MAEELNDFARLIREAGVVGAGGAGFPSYVKAASKADTVIVNAAECEPLLQKDQEILEHFTDEVLEGLRLLMRSTGASRGVLAVKEKHRKLIDKLGLAVMAGPHIRLRDQIAEEAVHHVCRTFCHCRRNAICMSSIGVNGRCSRRFVMVVGVIASSWCLSVGTSKLKFATPCLSVASR